MDLAAKNSPNEDLTNLTLNDKFEDPLNIGKNKDNSITTDDPNFPPIQHKNVQKTTLLIIPGLVLSKAQKKNMKNKIKKSKANEATATNSASNNNEEEDDSYNDSDYDTQNSPSQSAPTNTNIKDNNKKITDYYTRNNSMNNMQKINKSDKADKTKEMNITSKETDDHSKGTITDEEENMDTFYASLNAGTNLTKTKDITNNKSTTFFEDNLFKIHETNPSIFEKGETTDHTGIGTYSRIFKPPSSFSTPKSGRPKRSRSESLNNEVNGIKSIKFSDNVELLDMNIINPENNSIDDFIKDKVSPKTFEEPASEDQ